MKKISRTVITTLILVMLLVTTVFADSVNVAGFQDWNFTLESAVEPLVLQMDTDTVSFWATCNDESETDTITCIIIDKTHNGAYNSSFAFVADGSVTTYDSEFPAGRYRIYFIGSSDVVKAHAAAVFSQYTD